MKDKKYCVGTVPKPNRKRGRRGRVRIIQNWNTVESEIKHHEPQTTANSKIDLLIDWLIDWCLTSSEQFSSYIQDEKI